jgi:hypothetical protein
LGLGATNERTERSPGTTRREGAVGSGKHSEGRSEGKERTERSPGTTRREGAVGSGKHSEGRSEGKAFTAPARYNRAVRRVIVIAAAWLVACTPAPDPKRPQSSPAAPRKVDGARGSSPVNTNVSSNDAVQVPVIGCPQPTCAFHAGGGAYFTCLAGGAGACFHFGAPCTPSDTCMYDPADRSYKECARASEGTCQQWGAACAPASKCMFNATDGLHHQCDDVSGGACKRYGALCAP